MRNTCSFNVYYGVKINVFMEVSCIWYNFTIELHRKEYVNLNKKIVTISHIILNVRFEPMRKLL